LLLVIIIQLLAISHHRFYIKRITCRDIVIASVATQSHLKNRLDFTTSSLWRQRLWQSDLKGHCDPPRVAISFGISEPIPRNLRDCFVTSFLAMTDKRPPRN